jgi:ABC-2 type transport system permease protein
MLGLIKNELIKLHLRRKFIISALVLIAISGLISVGIFASYKMVKPEQIVKQQETMVSDLKAEREKASTDEDKAIYDKQIKQAEESLNMFKNLPKEEDENWKETLKNRVETLEAEVANASEFDGTKEMRRKELISNKYMLENNIRPINDLKPYGFNIFLILVSALGALFLVIIVAIITSDIVSAEYTPPTMKILLTRPVSRAKVFISKYISAIFASLLVILSVEILVSFVMGILFGFGDLSSPVTVGTQYKSAIVNAAAGREMVPVYNSTTIITMGEFIIRVLLYQVLFIVTATSFFMLLSTVLKSSAISMALSIVITIALNIVGSISYFKVIKPFLFTTYGDSVSVLTGNTIRSANNALASPSWSIVILIVFSIITYTLGHINFTKKDMLI